MNQTKNLIFAFLGGVAIGSLATVGAIKKLSKHKPEIWFGAGYIVEGGDSPQEPPKTGKGGNKLPTDIPVTDKPSFKTDKTIDTHKVQYDGVVSKPDLEDLAKRYADTQIEKEAAERESPEDDDDEYDEEAELENEIGESLMDHIGHVDDEDIQLIEGYGHVLFQLDNGRRDSLIYLIPAEYLGEVYPVEDLMYYTEDDVLTDYSDAPIDDPTRILGEALECFGQCGEEETEDKVFVRNCGIGIEYEVTRVEGYFGAKVYGVTEEEMRAVTKSSRKTTKKPSRKEDEE